MSLRKQRVRHDSNDQATQVNTCTLLISAPISLQQLLSNTQKKSREVSRTKCVANDSDGEAAQVNLSMYTLLVWLVWYANASSQQLLPNRAQNKNRTYRNAKVALPCKNCLLQCELMRFLQHICNTHMQRRARIKARVDSAFGQRARKIIRLQKVSKK